MKTLFLLVSTIVLVSALSKSWQELWNKEWEGFWEEDQYQRQNLAQFLDVRPEFSWFQKVVAKSASFELTMNIKKDRNYISMHGRTGPSKEFYLSEIVPDNITRTKVDMQQLGILETTAEIKELPNFGGHILVAYMHSNLEGNKDVIEIITTTTLDPRNPNEVAYVIKDVPSGVELIQVLRRNRPLYTPY